jgi:CubicO group peptidase (beta-lactamase class C family)
MGDETLVDWTDGGGHRPTETMSVTKLVVATVIAASLCKDVPFNEIRIRGLKTWDGTSGAIAGYGHDGDGGQRLVIYPELGGVAVRLRENLDTGAMWSAFPGDAQEVIESAVR